MADEGLTLNAGSDGSDLAVDSDGSSRKHQYVKLKFGGSGIFTHVEPTVGLPVNLIDINGVAPSVNAGNVDAGTQRVVIASDQATVTVDNAGLTELAAAINVSSQMDVNIAASAATVTVDGSSVTQPISHAALTELAAAINTNELDVNIASSGATVAVSNAGLTELAAAINVSSQMDVNIAASAATVTVSGTVTADAGTGTFAVSNAGLTELAAAINVSSQMDVNIAASAATVTTTNAAISGSEVLIAGGATQTNDVKVTLDSEAVVLGAGSAAIGKLAANDGVDIGDVDVATQPARDNATDTITASLDTAAIMNDTTALTPKFAIIDYAASPNNELVAAVVGKKVRVLSMFMVAAGDVIARIEDGAGGTALTGQMDLTANSGFTLPFSPVGWFETTANTALNLELDTTVSCDGCLVYVEV